MIYEITDGRIVSGLFGAWEETMIFSCLQGVMGYLCVDSPDHPRSAAAMLGDFAFFAGEPNAELAAYCPAWRNKHIMLAVPQNEGWRQTILQCYGERAWQVERYALKKEPDVFDAVMLEQAVASLPLGYELCMMDENCYRDCLDEDWSADLVSQFPSYEAYRALGLGVVIRKDHRIVAGASSYSRYREGIEIEIDTKEEYRRKGLAYVCGAKLISECLKRNLYPSWDAQNPVSLHLAEKLGYHYSHTYTAIEVYGC